jgi:hypothetical protein
VRGRNRRFNCGRFEQHPLIAFLGIWLNPSNLDGLYRLSSANLSTGILLNIRSRYASLFEMILSLHGNMSLIIFSSYSCHLLLQAPPSSS